MSDIIRFKGHSYILATSPRLLTRTLTLKEGDSFAVFDRYGDTGAVGAGEQGVYHKGMRVLSHHEFRLGQQRPLLLSSTVHEQNAFVACDLTNPDIQMDENRILQRGTVHIFRGQFLLKGALYCRTRVHNYSDVPLDSDLIFLFDADFADVFEVRGVKRHQRGTRRTHVQGRVAELAYDGLDDITRRARIEFSMVPADLTATSARFAVRLPAHESVELFHTVSFEAEFAATPSEEAYNTNREALVAQLKRNEACGIVTSNEQFNHWLDRSTADLHMLTTEREGGPYPYAGVPWFSTVFGRDGLITAMQYLWVDPSLARGVLATLAGSQAEEVVPAQDAEPGKILHEMRDGEMAGLGEVPYARY
ncbi:MAG: amylo-alpha-1,6-glucosidase, partial [Rhodospirillales bacterium]|nr:amylo-alpha-1,6-glucosidase [Rhodospirillales bacterium]